MPVYTRSLSDSLVVSFERDGEAPETQVVLGLSTDRTRAGERALLYAVSMLVNRRLLMAGDKLTVRADDGADVTASSSGLS
jgi:hypothetical protein